MLTTFQTQLRLSQVRTPFHFPLASSISSSLNCSPCPAESLDQFYRRRLRQARDVATKVGLWSIMWCHRIQDWNSHLVRGKRYNHICYLLSQHMSTEWLLFQRSAFVNSQNSLHAGRTGPRSNIGKPQPRWTESLPLAVSLIETEGHAAVSISTRIRDAVRALNDNIVSIFVPDAPPHPSSDTNLNSMHNMQEDVSSMSHA